MGENLEIIRKFDVNSMPDLDVCVMAALELFMEKGVPEVNLDDYKKPLVVGSGNAAVTGKILFYDSDARPANESDFEDKTEGVDGAVLISASGGKHAPVIAGKLKDMGVECRLLTCNPNAAAKDIADYTAVFHKNREPYTYNTSTYMGMILAKTGEDPKEIYDFIMNEVAPRIPDNIAGFNGYYLLVPTEFDSIREMYATKFVELFGRKVARDVFTVEQAKHATTVVPSDELFIDFGDSGLELGENRLVVPLPDFTSYGAMMAVGYYVIGKIQSGKEPYFKQNIADYCKKASLMFGSDIKPIVE